MFIGREAELAFLHDRYESNQAQLIVLYGRRRIGKTETLRQFCKDKPHVFYACTQTTDSVQLQKFSNMLLNEKIPASQYLTSFHDWQQSFGSIAELDYGSSKKLVVIDEFPYMCHGNSSIPSILQNLWDSELKNQNVMIILCGSSMSFIEKELLAEKNPLYGRATGIYKMNEMSFYDAVKFFPNYSAEEKIISYAILGGIPHYLNQFDSKLSLAENIKKNILTKGSVLYSEVEFLLHQELRETTTYNSIIETIALGSTKLNEISQKSLIDDTSKTSTYLKNLIDLGIVKKEFSVDVHLKSQANAKRGLYRLTDSFFRFWYHFCFANFSQLEEGDVEGVYQYLIAPELLHFTSFVFEDICQQFVMKLQRKNQLPFRYAKIGRWQGKTTIRDLKKDTPKIAETEIDVLAIDRDNQKYLIGECKFKKHPFSYSEYLSTRMKFSNMQNKELYYVLFSKSGFDEKIINEKSANVLLFDLEEIVAG